MDWTPSSNKPKSFERKILCWVVWPETNWYQPPEAIIGWWKDEPQCFSVKNIENANPLVTHYAEIDEPETS